MTRRKRLKATATGETLPGHNPAALAFARCNDTSHDVYVDVHRIGADDTIDDEQRLRVLVDGDDLVDALVAAGVAAGVLDASGPSLLTRRARPPAPPPPPPKPTRGRR